MSFNWDYFSLLSRDHSSEQLKIQSLIHTIRIHIHLTNKQFILVDLPISSKSTHYTPTPLYPISTLRHIFYQTYDEKSTQSHTVIHTYLTQGKTNYQNDMPLAFFFFFLSFVFISFFSSSVRFFLASYFVRMFLCVCE